MTARRPILVTGSHRSGTTWVGRMIAASPQVGYIHEPFNFDYPQRPGICDIKVPYWFTYVTAENEAPYYQALKSSLSFHFDIGAELTVVRSVKDVKGMLKGFAKCSLYRSRRAVPLLKDPLALFSAEWLSNRFNMDVVVMIRHPAAFASSLRRLKWRHDFSHFLNQPLLMRDHLSIFKEEITDFVNHEHDLLDQAVLLWRIIHYMILKYQNDHHDWVFLRHEDISRDPVSQFQYLFKRFDLDFSQQVRTVIEDYSSSSNPGEMQGDQMYGKLNSKSNILSWKTKFSESEIVSLRRGVEDISKEFYTDSDW